MNIALVLALALALALALVLVSNKQLIQTTSLALVHPKRY